MQGALNYEYKVRFKGYGSDDMWLPASFFSRAIHFESTSKYGRKRKHVTEANGYSEEPLQAKHRKQKSKQEESILLKTSLTSAKSRTRDNGKQQSKRKIGHGEHDKDGRAQRKANARKPKTEGKGMPKSSAKKMGLKFRQSLKCVNTEESISSSSDSEIETKFSCQKVKAKKLIEESEDSDIIEKEQDQVKRKTDVVQSENILQSCKDISFIDERTFSSVINTKEAQFLVVENPSNPCSYAPSICKDLLRGTDDFVTGREELQQVKIPLTNPTLTVSDVISLSEAQQCLNPLAVSEIPPLDTVEESEIKLRNAKKTGGVPNAAVLIEGYGVLNKHGLTVLRQYHRFKVIVNEVEVEKRWIMQAFCKETDSDRKMVEAALFKNSSGQSKFLVSRNGSRVTAQVLSTFCEERYLCDESINILLRHYCTQANEHEKKSSFIALPAYLSDTRTVNEVIKASVKRNLRDINPEEVECIFVPAHFQGKDHWGLGVINLKEGTVSYDDGSHVPRPPSLVRICEQTIKAIREVSDCSVHFPTSLKYQRLSPPMPDQAMGVHQRHGYGSCGVAVILCAGDLCNRKKHFDWNFNQSPFLRAKLMVELAKLSCNF